MATSTQTRREVRSGLVALAVTGPLFTLGIILRGAIDISDITSLIREALSPGFASGWTLIVFGFVLQLYGFFGLYRYLTTQSESLIALWGFALRTVGGALGVPVFLFLAINGPEIARRQQRGDPDAIVVLERFFTGGLGVALLGFATTAAVVGFILFVIAMWRDGRLPRWTVVVFTLSLPLLAIAVTLVTELLGGLLWLISTAVIAWKGWQESAVPTPDQ